MICSGLVLMCFCGLFGQVRASAIPMWEYLSKQEKTSYLYSLFANQVEAFCESSTLEACNQNLLRFGLNKLKSLPEEYLDSMDPYQRDSSRIIWETMLAGHPLAGTTPKPRRTTTAKPNSYDDESFSDLDFGSQSSASAKIDNFYRLTPPQNILQQYNRKPYFRLQERYSTEEVPIEDRYYLTGPMVVKVYPDGTPVKEQPPMPQDEDLRQYKLSQVKVPNL